MALPLSTSADHLPPPRDDLVRALPGTVALRSSDDGGLGVLHGRLVPYNEWAEIKSAYEGHFMERFAVGTFAKSILEQRSRLQVLYEHGLDPQIGRKVLGPILSLDEWEDGVDYEVDLLDTAYNRELLPAIEAGLLGSSVRFRVKKDDFMRRPTPSDFNPDGIPERTVREAAMVEFGPCPFPTYDGATAGLRSRTDEWLSLRFGGQQPGAFVPPSFSVFFDDTPLLEARTRSDADAVGLAEELEVEFEGEIRGDDPTGRAYARIIRYVTQTPWAIHPDSMSLITTLLVDRLAGERLSDAEIADRLGSRSLFDDLQDDAPEETSPVAVIPVAGPIVPHGDLLTRSSGMTSVSALQEQFRKALDSPDVRAIVFEMDTPGGAVDLIPELAAEIRDARGQKPIIAVANTWAASAGYYLASQADRVVVTPSGEVGSIGVISAHRDFSEALAKQGVKVTTITAGKYKGERDPAHPLTDEARGEIQRQVDARYEQFVADVAAGRGVSVETVESDFGQGRMLMADEALAAGMVDRVATLDEVVGELEKLYGASSAPDAEPGPSPTPGEPGPSPTPGSDGAGAEPHSGSEATAAGKGAASMLEEQTKLTLEELAQRQDEIRDRLQEIHTEHPAGVLPPALQDEWDALIEERDLANKPAMQAARTRLAQVSEYADERARQVDVVEGARVLGAGPTFNTRRTNLPDNLHDIAEYRTRVSSLDELPALYREGAMHVVERSSFPHPKADREDAQGHIERLLGNDSKDGEIARRILATGSPAYDRAYGKMVMGRALTADEQRQLASFSGSDADGGYAVPFTLDPTVILTSDGQVNPLRQIARLIQLASGNTWKGVRSAGVTASYDAEGTETTDDSPSLEQPELTVDKAQAFVPFTIEIDQDWPSLRSEIAMMIQEAKDELEADKFLTGAGHGSKEPEGLLVGSTYHVSTGSSNALTVPEDLSLIMGDLPARFRGRASWVANLFFYNTIRAGDDNGTLYVKLTEGVPGMLMGRPAYEASEMAAALTDGYEIAVYGDFSKFAIVDKIGLNTELIPHLFKTARNYPSGERGLYAYWRNTSGVLVDKAFRKLAVKS